MNLAHNALRIAAAAVLLVGASAAPILAQDAPPRGRGGRGQIVRPAELAVMLDAYTVMQAQASLHLTDAQFGPFITRLHKLQENRRRNAEVRNKLLQQLRAMVAPGATADDNAIREKLRALREHNEQSGQILRRDIDALDEVLDPRQQVRFRLLEERLERMKLDLLMRARGRGNLTVEGRKPVDR